MKDAPRRSGRAKETAQRSRGAGSRSRPGDASGVERATSRNELCPCGSGRKYKRCHGAASTAPAAAPSRPLSRELVAALLEQGAVLQKSGRLQEAERTYRAVLDSQPSDVVALGRLGVLALETRQPQTALPLLGLAARLAPQSAEAQYNHGCALLEIAEFEKAARCFERAIELQPDFAEAYSNLCNVYKYLGRVEQALQLYRHAMALTGHRDAALHSNLLICLHLTDALSHEQLFAEHQRWAELHASKHYPAAPVYRNSRDPERKLRIGFVSPNFTSVIIGHFLRGVFAALDQNRYMICCYSATPELDAMSHTLRASATLWRDIAYLDDDAAAELIRADQIDVLVDLAGHAPKNRLGIFARKPAPVQMAWLDYFNTTGLATMDYLVTDRIATPEGSPQKFVEQLLFMPDSRFCYTPLEDAPDPAPPPVLTRGHITFGSFNRLDKINDGVIDAWAEILRRLPKAKLILKSAALRVPDVRRSYRDRFTTRGVDAERVELRASSPHQAMLREHGDIDIALDTFPYNGGATTLDALWMGVPVVTWAGERMISRQTAGMLSCVKLEDFVARNAREYVELAVAKALEVEHLREVRAGLREQMRLSALCDAQRCARGLEDNFRLAWRRWCAAQATFKESTHATN